MTKRKQRGNHHALQTSHRGSSGGISGRASRRCRQACRPRNGPGSQRRSRPDFLTGRTRRRNRLCPLPDGIPAGILPILAERLRDRLLRLASVGPYGRWRSAWRASLTASVTNSRSGLSRPLLPLRKHKISRAWLFPQPRSHPQLSICLLSLRKGGKLALGTERADFIGVESFETLALLTWASRPEEGLKSGEVGRQRQSALDSDKAGPWRRSDPRRKSS